MHEKWSQISHFNPHMQSFQEMHDVVPQLLQGRCTLGVLPQESKVFLWGGAAYISDGVLLKIAISK